MFEFWIEYVRNRYTTIHYKKKLWNNRRNKIIIYLDVKNKITFTSSFKILSSCRLCYTTLKIELLIDMSFTWKSIFSQTKNFSITFESDRQTILNLIFIVKFCKWKKMRKICKPLLEKKICTVHFSFHTIKIMVSYIWIINFTKASTITAKYNILWEWEDKKKSSRSIVCWKT